jgi:hypothetical protein
MDCIYRFRNTALAIFFILVVFGRIAPSSPQAQSRSGKVVDHPTSYPIAVMVKAWPDSVKTGDEGGCPVFGKIVLYSTQSNGNDGVFTLSVDPSVSTYTVTYCANGYYPRADKALSAKNLTIIPTPVRMYPQNTANQVDPDVVRNEAVAAFNTLAYLRSINSDQFDRVLKELPGGEKFSAAINDWTKR